MFQKAIVDLKCLAAILLIVMSANAYPLQAEETIPPEKEKPVLTPEMKKTLDKAASHLRGWLDKHDKKIRANERRLFATPEKILRLCRSPMRPKKYRPVLNHFKATKGDPVSLPTIDCVFLKNRQGGGRLWSYKPAKDKSYYILRAHEGMTPRGGYAFARHPLNFIHRQMFNRSEWVTTRSTFTPLDAFPLKMHSTLDLTEQSEGEEPAKLTAKVVKSFPIVHQVNGKSKQVETLHIVVKNLAPQKIFGKLQDRRRWYIYSQKANVFLQRSHAMTLQDSINKAESFVWKTLSYISYIKDGRYILELSAKDLAPLRAYLEGFDVWDLK